MNLIKLKILLPFLLLNWVSFSQKDTSKICFDYTTAQLIAIDLVRGDSAIAELQQVHQKNITLEQIIENQQQILNEIKNNKNALNNQELVNKINKISKNQEMLLKKRFN